MSDLLFDWLIKSEELFKEASLALNYSSAFYDFNLTLFLSTFFECLSSHLLLFFLLLHQLIPREVYKIVGVSHFHHCSLCRLLILIEVILKEDTGTV